MNGCQLQLPVTLSLFHYWGVCAGVGEQISDQLAFLVHGAMNQEDTPEGCYLYSR